MAVSITATPESDNLPPRVRIDMASGASETLATIEVRRNGTVLRGQPTPGSDAAVAYDYDAPFGVALTYQAAGGYYPSAAAEWSESWSSLASWTGDTSDFTVASSHARSTVSDKAISRATVAEVGKVVVGGTPEYVLLDLLDAGGSVLGSVGWITNYAALVLYDAAGIGAASLGLAAGGATVSIYGGQVSVTLTSDGRGMAAALPGVVRGVQVRSADYIAGLGVTAKIGSIAVTPTQSLTGYQVDDSATLDVDQAWLLHPVDPDRSVPLSGGASAYGAGLYGIGLYGGALVSELMVTSESGRTITREAQREVFAPLGRSRRVPVTFGNRRPGDWSLQLVAPTIADRDALVALLEDQRPVLLRRPPGNLRVGIGDLPDGWYSVGDVEDERIVDLPTQIVRVLTLPLIPVDEPVLTQGAQWTYADVLATYATYADVLASYATYLDLQVGP